MRASDCIEDRVSGTGEQGNPLRIYLAAFFLSPPPLSVGLSFRIHRNPISVGRSVWTTPARAQTCQFASPPLTTRMVLPPPPFGPVGFRAVEPDSSTSCL